MDDVRGDFVRPPHGTTPDAVIRNNNERYPSRAVNILKRSQGGQKKHYKDTFKTSLKDYDIPILAWVQTAQERSKWRGLINKGASRYEKREYVKLKLKESTKHRERKANTIGPPGD